MDATHLLTCKLSADCHLIADAIIERQNVLAQLDKSRHYALTVIHAPAGYGKTSVTMDWVTKQQRKSRCLVWYSLDEMDNNPIQFAQYFAGLLQQATGIDMPEYDDFDSRDSDSSHEYDLQCYMSRLIALVSDVSFHFTLIMDNYACITERVIHDAMRWWIGHQPSTMHIVLLSRTLPPLRLTKWKIGQQLQMIGVKQMAFSSKEAASFFAKSSLNKGTAVSAAHIINNTAISAINDYFEGWPLGLYVAELAASGNPTLLNDPSGLLESLRHEDVQAYIEEEVLYHFDDETRKFLMLSSIAQVLNEPIVHALTQDDSSLKRLYEIEKQGVFIRRCPEYRGFIQWTFAPLVRSYLHLQCRLHFSRDWQTLNISVAQTWLSLHNYHQALYHAQQIENVSLLYDILQEHGWELFHQGQLSSLEQSIGLLPAEMVWGNESLLLLKAWLAQSQHRAHEVHEILGKFNPQTPLSGALLGKCLALKAQVAINAGDEQKAYQLATEALVYIPKESKYARTVAMSVIGEAQHCQGDLAAALATMKHVEKTAIEYKVYHYWLWSRLQQSEILSAQGYWQSAYELLEDQHYATPSLKRIPLYEFLLHCKGQVLWEWLRLDEAEAAAREGGAIAKEGDKARCLTLLAKISLTKGKLDNTKRIIDECQQLLTAFPAHHDWLASVSEIQLLYWQATNNVDRCDSWLAQAHHPDGHQNHFLQKQWRNIARCYLLLQRFDEAHEILDRIIQSGPEYGLVSDVQRAYILRCRAYALQGHTKAAQKDLVEALKLSRKTNFISAFVIEGDVIAQQIRRCIQTEQLDNVILHKAKFILKSVNKHNQHKFAHFDDKFIEQLLTNPQVPELLKISPLTSREWQVLGLIYSGYSNEQIGQELLVAITTVKTHVRNLYQKLGVTNRREVIQYTQEILAVANNS